MEAVEQTSSLFFERRAWLADHLSSPGTAGRAFCLKSKAKGPKVVATDTRIADVARVEQKKAFYCGPACCHIFLGKYGLSLIQREAFSLIDTSNTEPDEWHSDPDGMSKYLNDRAGTQLEFSIDDFNATAQDQAIDQLYYTLNILGIPCPSLVQKGGHWVVVDGFREEVNERNERALLGFWVRDPWYNRPPERYVGLAEFRAEYLTPISHGTKWKDKIVVLSKASGEELFRAKSGELSTQGGGAGGGLSGKALVGIELHGFTGMKEIDAGGGVPVIEPIEVTRLDDPSEKYVIAPLDASENSEFEDYVYVAIQGLNDARLLEIAAFSGLLDILDNKEAEEHCRRELPGSKIEVVDGYFWKWCFDLRSRFDVVRKVKVDGQDRFLLPNGRIVEKLREFEHGGG